MFYDRVIQIGASGKERDITVCISCINISAAEGLVWILYPQSKGQADLNNKDI